MARACSRSASPGSRRAVICPSLVPDVEPVEDPKLSGPIARANTLGYSLMSFNNGLVGRHFILGSGSPRWLHHELFDTVNEGSTRKPRRLPDQRVGGVTARLYAFYGGPNSGHVGAIVKREDGLEAFASMHGARYTDATVLLALDLARRPRP